MKRLLFLAIGITVAILARSQTLNPELTGSGGDSQSSGAYLIDWSTGEMATETFSAGSYILTQGFQQTTTSNPSISAIVSPTEGGSFGTGQTIEVSVEFGTEMELTGGPLIVELSNGKTIEITAIDPTDPTRATGTYVITADDGDLSGLNVTSVTLGTGAVLTDTNGLPVIPETGGNITVPTGNNLADNVNIHIDKSGPFNVLDKCVDTGNGNISLFFTESFITEHTTKKRGANDLQITDLEITITGGVATLGTTVLTKTNDLLYYLNLDLQGVPDGNEIVTISMINGSKIKDLQGNIGQFNPVQIPLKLPAAVPLSPYGIVGVFGLILLIAYRKIV